MGRKQYRKLCVDVKFVSPIRSWDWPDKSERLMLACITIVEEGERGGLGLKVEFWFSPLREGEGKEEGGRRGCISTFN